MLFLERGGVLNIKLWTACHKMVFIHSMNTRLNDVCVVLAL